MADEFRWGPVTKVLGETKPVVLSLFGLCARFWEPNEEYQSGDIIWPLVTDANGYISGIGYCFEATQAGRSAAIQPRFANAMKTGPSVAVNTAIVALDGSVQWTCRPPGSGGISAASLASPEYIAPAGITVSSVAINESMKLFVDYADGTLDEDYELEFRFLIAGRVRIGRQVVKVRKK